LNLFNRSLALMKWAYPLGIDLAVSHNSYEQLLASFLMGIPSVTMMDYEYQPANHLSFRLARRVIVPEFFPEDALRVYGATPRKTRKYSGLKEEVYLSSFVPDPSFLSKVGLDNERVIVTVRPPATFALYHRFENPLFQELLDWLNDQDDILIVLLPRTNEQKSSFLEKKYKKVFIPSQALDGPNLLFYSDLVISAGGTMNREAAVLGTPVYTIFAGRVAAVDDYLIKIGKMVRLRDRSDLNNIRLCKRDFNGFKPSESLALKSIVDLILNVPSI